MKSRFKYLVEFRIVKLISDDVFQVVNLQGNNLHALDKIVLVSRVVIRLFFSSSEVGDDVDVQLVRGEDAIGIQNVCSQVKSDIMNVL